MPMILSVSASRLFPLSTMIPIGICTTVALGDQNTRKKDGLFYFSPASDDEMLSKFAIDSKCIVTSPPAQTSFGGSS
jgi:hypothetical protein